ncbi:hypothetical protein V1498_04880 [Peribacillus sp. SCS-26]|uniref:hypothetical protein n=1 Tax=Paraperibacillus marinus TaxID=3115295 RepID=UPI003906968F
MIKWKGSWLSKAVLTGMVAGLILSGSQFSGQAEASKENSCFDPTVKETLEEQRIKDGAPIPQQILEVTNFDQFIDKFNKDLCSSPNVDQALKAIETNGTQLWRTAVDRAQGKRPDLGDLDRYDDRPLYWARLYMVLSVRQWNPKFEVSDEKRKELIKRLEYNSRGISSIDFPSGKGVKRILVSGFDPYQLEQEFRRSNPSGASALQLDGLKVMTEDGPAFVQAVNFPVRWQDFEDGIVEDSFAPYLIQGKQRADLIMTISQGGPRRMAIEGYAGRWHTGRDNAMETRAEVVPTVTHWPMPLEQPEFIETTLPYQEMIEAGTGPWTVMRNDRVCELRPPDFSNPQVCKDDGPTPGSIARSGGGGAYLSNESMYRSNRVRLGLGAYDVPGGHLHISALEFYPADKTVYIDHPFQNHRQVTVDQTVELVKVAARAIH